MMKNKSTLLRKLVLGICVLLLSLPACAKDWSKVTTARGDGAFYQADSGEKSLMLGCFRSDTALSFTLMGGALPLHESLQHRPSLIVWIILADGRTGRYAIDTEYLGGLDNALVGRLLLGEEGKRFFAQGVEMSISSAQAGEFFRTGLSGSARAMQDFRDVCRI